MRQMKKQIVEGILPNIALVNPQPKGNCSHNLWGVKWAESDYNEKAGTH